MDKPSLLYYRSPEQLEAYRRMPALQKVRKIEAEMEMMYYMRLARGRSAAKGKVRKGVI